MTKERLQFAIDEALGICDHYDLFRSSIESIIWRSDNAEDIVKAVKVLLDETVRPRATRCLEERMLLSRTWSRNDWQKKYQARRRRLARYGLNPDEAQMFPHPEGNAPRKSYMRDLNMTVEEQARDAAALLQNDKSWNPRDYEPRREAERKPLTANEMAQQLNAMNPDPGKWEFVPSTCTDEDRAAPADGDAFTTFPDPPAE